MRTTLAAVIGLAGLGAVVLVGGRGEPAERDTTPTPSTAAAAVGSESPALPTVVIAAQDDENLAGDRVVDRLRPGGVVRVRAGGFGSFERGVIEQCATGRDGRRACGNAFGVQFGEDGRAELQYQLVDAFTPGRCRARAATCAVVLTGTDTSRLGAVRTVLVDAYRPGLVRVTPRTGLRAGQAVDVQVEGLAPDAGAEVRFCATPGRYDADRCQAVGAGFTIGSDGSGSVRVTVAAGRVGRQGARCGPQHGCAVVVLTGDGFESAATFPVRYSLGPGADYDAGRLAVGLAVAFTLLVLAAALVRRTDWSRPTEADTPEMDAADLQTGGSLDELFGTDAELDAAYPISS
ncbi:MAG: hypothetical protein ACRDZW_03050 [Acidimicrobiales bacterium]